MTCFQAKCQRFFLCNLQDGNGLDETVGLSITGGFLQQMEISIIRVTGTMPIYTHWECGLLFWPSNLEQSLLNSCSYVLTLRKDISGCYNIVLDQLRVKTPCLLFFYPWTAMCIVFTGLYFRYSRGLESLRHILNFSLSDTIVEAVFPKEFIIVPLCWLLSCKRKGVRDLLAAARASTLCYSDGDFSCRQQLTVSLWKPNMLE